MRKMGVFLVLLFVISSFVFAINSNRTITFQGRLIDSIGSPVNGTRKMMFKIHGTSEGNTKFIHTIASGSPGYNDPNQDGFLNNKDNQYKHTTICNDGNYAAEIALTPEQVAVLNSFQDAYLEIFVGNASDVTPFDIMSPRIHLSASPYALTAKQIDGLIIQRGDDSPVMNITSDNNDKDLSIYY